MRTIGKLGCVLILACTGLLPTQSVLGADKCVRVVGYDWSTVNKIDPALYATQIGAMHLRAIFDPLVNVDNSFRVTPMLAESWEANDSATEWTIHVRKNVQFHDGTPLTAKDVIYTIKRLIDPTINSPAISELGFIKPENLVQVDDFTIRLALDQPESEVPIRLASKYMHIIKEGTTTEQLQTGAIGTGPFVLGAYTPDDQKTTLQRNPNYWQAGLPKSNCLELSSITEPVSRAAAIISGEVDVLTIADPGTIASLRDSGKVDIEEAKGGTALYMAMWVDTKPFDDVRVRQALKLVVDRQVMVDTALLGFGSPGNDNPIPPTSSEAYRSDIIPRDVARAKQLLADAGYPNGLTVDLYTGDVYPGILISVEAYRQMAAEAGITINTVISPADSYWDETYMKKSFYSSYRSPRPPVTGLALTHRSNSSLNETNWKRPDYDALLDKAAATVDADARRVLYNEAQRMLAEEGGDILYALSSNFSATRKGCKGYMPHVNVNYIDYTMLECE